MATIGQWSLVMFYHDFVSLNRMSKMESFFQINKTEITSQLGLFMRKINNNEAPAHAAQSQIEWNLRCGV